MTGRRSRSTIQAGRARGEHPGRLVLVGTPLGNREDFSPRARRTVLEADLVLCEDTRSLPRLLGTEDRLPPRKSCFVANEHERTALLLEELSRGNTVAYVSEAGLPIWSDPGRLLVRAAVEGGYEVDVIPGPTAAAVAVCHSGFQAEDVRFVGFPPRIGRERATWLRRIADEPAVAVVYEAGNRVPELLRDLARSMIDADHRPAIVARELTKMHQEVLRGTVGELAERVVEPLRGEVTIVLGGSERTEEPQSSVRDSARAVLDTVLDGSLKPRQKARRLAELTGIDAREIYAKLTELRTSAGS